MDGVFGRFFEWLSQPEEFELSGGEMAVVAAAIAQPEQDQEQAEREGAIDGG
jgi:hypothetical protein